MASRICGISYQAFGIRTDHGCERGVLGKLRHDSKVRSFELLRKRGFHFALEFLTHAHYLEMAEAAALGVCVISSKILQALVGITVEKAQKFVLPRCAVADFR